ncbi:MAG: DUF1499 domain-containing protein [Cyanobacteriota bacterium]|jgi:uncharacterized protein (DUF1499 family)
MKSLTFLFAVGLAALLVNFAVIEPSQAALPGTSALFAGSAPTNLGVAQGCLAPCPETPNCVSSQAPDAVHRIDPLSYSGERAAARQTLIQVLGAVPRTQIVAQGENYIRAESESRLLGFIDDLEFYFPPDSASIEVRSSSRLGESDLGVNRRRLEQIRLALLDLGA